MTTSPTRQYPGYRVPHYESADLTLTLAQEASLDSKPSSRVEVKAKDKPLRCGQTEEIFVKYTIAGEQPSKDWALMYMVSNQGQFRSRAMASLLSTTLVGTEEMAKGPTAGCYTA